MTSSEQAPAVWTDLFARRARADGGTEIAQIMALAGRTDVISFAGGFPDPAVIDRAALTEVMNEIGASDELAPLQYAPNDGLPGFRAYLAERIERQEGAPVRSEELLVTSGGIEAMQLMATVFLDAGDTVLVEAPTYLGAPMSFSSFEAHVAAVPVDDDGLEVDVLASMLADGLRPKFLYTNPDHQNPAGVTLSEERRPALVELALAHGFPILEDVAYREFTFDRSPPPSLWSLAPQAVVQIGTFSKIFSPGTRLGWAVGPPEVVQRLGVGEAVHRPVRERHVAAGGGGDGRRGHLDSQVERATTLYEQRCRRMLECFESELPEDVGWTRPLGGFFTWLTLPEGAEALDVATRAADAGVAVVPGNAFFPDDRGRRHVRVCFSRAGLDEIEEGVRILGTVLRAA